MPSWNIHIAQTERLLAAGGSVARTVCDCNAFLFGSLVPDVCVGYMVPAIKRPIPYHITHFASPEHIPKPREREFWEMYVGPLMDDHPRYFDEHGGGAGCCCDLRARSDFALGSLTDELAYVAAVHALERDWTVDFAVPVASQDATCRRCPRGCAFDGTRRSLVDLVLGAWAHLVADSIWNQRVSEYLANLGERPSKSIRIKKQGDFDLFGKSLTIDAIPCVTPTLIDAARMFPQYSIDAYTVYSSVAVAHEVVRANHLEIDPVYQLLQQEFFARVFDEVLQETEDRLSGYMTKR